MAGYDWDHVQPLPAPCSFLHPLTVSCCFNHTTDWLLFTSRRVRRECLSEELQVVLASWKAGEHRGCFSAIPLAPPRRSKA